MYYTKTEVMAIQDAQNIPGLWTSHKSCELSNVCEDWLAMRAELEQLRAVLRQLAIMAQQGDRLFGVAD